MAKPIMAILYDFDKTLSIEDMQNYGFIPAMGMTPKEFWGKTGEFSKETGCERILSYMYMMIKCAKDNGIKLTKEWLNEQGQKVTYYDGVETWFKRINKYGKDHGVIIEHYLVSSGTKEIVEGTSIAKYFKAIYGCEFLYDKETKEAVWPKLAVNYTQKTQYLFRISKGVIDATNDNKLNSRTPKHRIPWENMVYIGDGMTDIPCMVLVKENHGKAIAVYNKEDRQNVMALGKDKRIQHVCRADYTEGSSIDKIIKLVVDSVAVRHELEIREIKDQ